MKFIYCAGGFTEFLVYIVVDWGFHTLEVKKTKQSLWITVKFSTAIYVPLRASPWRFNVVSGSGQNNI